MQNSFDTSFIPQQPLLKVEGFERRRASFNLALVLALTVFFITLVVAAGVYFYHRSVVNQVRDLSLELENKEKLLDISEINRLKNVDLRIAAAKELLRNHGVFTTIFDFLEKSTLQNVGLTSLSYSANNTGSTLSLGAVAPSYQAVYLQGQTWEKMKPIIKSVKVGPPQLSESTGIVQFSADITLNNSLLRYVDVLQAQTSEQTSVSTEMAGSSSTTVTATTTTP